MRKLALLALLPAIAWAQGGLSSGNSATISGNSAAACFSSSNATTGTISLNLPNSGNSNTGGISFVNDGCGNAGTVNLGYNTGTGFLTVNGAGLILNGTQLNLGSSGATRSIEIQQSAGNIGIDLQTSGAKLCLANGTDCLSDSGGTLTTSAGFAVTGSSTASVNMGASNSSCANNFYAGSGVGCAAGPESFQLIPVSAGRFKGDLSSSTDAAVSFDFVMKGGGSVQLPKIANASLLACTASTEDTTHSQAGAIAFDSTNNALAVCDGTAWRDITLTPVDFFIPVYDPVTAVGTTGDVYITGPTKSAATIQDATYVVPIVGGGTGTLTTKWSSAASGGGTVFVTCSIACNAAAGTTGACTVNAAAIPAATTLHYGITTACTTADVTNTVTLHGTNP
jgi:hypothetical protein